MISRKHIELGFERWGRSVARRPGIAALLPLLLTVGLGALVPQLRIDTSNKSFLHPTSPARVLYNQFRNQFGRDDVAIVVLHPPEIFDLGFLAKLRAFHEELEREVPFLDEVTSLVNARWTRGDGDELIVDDLLADWPDDPAELDVVRRRALANPLYRNYLLSEDGTHTTVLVKPLTHAPGDDLDDLAGFDAPAATSQRAGAPEAGFLGEADVEEFVHALLAVVERHRAPDFEISVAGNPVLNAHMNAKLRNDIAVFGAVSTLVVAALLFAVFRRLAGVVLPLLVVGGALVSSLGCMVLLDIPMSMALQILPSLLLTVGVCGAVHILVIFYQALDAGRSTEEAVAVALGHSGLAVFLASVTTAMGLLSFLTADLAPVAHIGIVGPIGVMLSFVYVVVLLPALLVLLGSRRGWREGASTRAVGRVLAAVGGASGRRPYRVLAATALVVAIGCVGVARLRISQDFLDWFPDGDWVQQATRLVDAQFRGVTTLEVVVDTGRDDGLYEPEMLKRIDSAMRHAEAIRGGPVRIGKAISIVDVLKETHQALNENDASFYRVPDDRSAVAQELLLFESSGSDDLEDLTDSRYRKARIAMRATWMDSILYPPFLEQLQADLQRILGDDVQVQLTGLMVLLSQSISAVVETMARSYLLAFIVITPTMILLIGDLRLGLLSMFPNLLPVFLTLALMGWLGMALDTSNLIVGCIVMGLAVDDTIHFIHKFRRYLDDGEDVQAAVRHTLETTGAAMLTTSLVLCAGFLSFLFAYMVNAVQLGLLAAFATATAFLADVILTPALVALAARPRSR